MLECTGVIGNIVEECHKTGVQGGLQFETGLTNDLLTITKRSFGFQSVFFTSNYSR